MISGCLDALINQNYPKDDYEIVVVNDGSTDGTLKSIEDRQKEARAKNVALKVVNLEKNLGHTESRESGARNTTYDKLLFIDSRCIAYENILKKLAEINYQPLVGNPVIDFDRSVFDRFNWLIKKKLYRDSFGDNFMPIYITPENFDKASKGTTVFFCDKQLFLSSQPEFKGKTASDDTKLLWNIVRKKNLLKHPDVKVFYRSRTTLKGTIKHTFNRGPKFVDYYLNPNKKYFWIFIFAPLLLLSFAVLSIALKPFCNLFWLGFIAVALGGLAVWLSENFKDFFISIFFLPLFALSFESGIICGLLMKLKKFFKQGKAVLIFIVAIALISGFFWSRPMFGRPVGSDQGFYDNVAQNILTGKDFTDRGRDAGIEPLYPLFLAGIYKVFGHNYDIVRIIQIIIFALSVVFVYLLSKRLFGRRVAIWSSIATALFYGIANQAGSLTTETLFIFLLTVFAWAIYNASINGKYVWFAAAGAILGLAALTRGIIQYFFILAAINLFILYYRKIPAKGILLRIGIFLVSFFIVLTPWLIKERLAGGSGAEVAPRTGGGLASRVERMEKIYPNYAGHFIGRLFGYYFSEKLGYNVKYEDYRHVTDTDQKLNELIKAGKSEVEIDQILSAEAKKKILAEPQKYILISIIDFISFNSPILPQKSNFQNTLEIHPMFAGGRHPEIPGWEKAAIILIIRSCWFLFLFFAVYGAVKSVKNPRRDGMESWQKFGWILLIILYFNLAYSAIHAIPRYALPIYPFYIILFVIGLVKFYEKIKN